jgi:hypothetical protein
VNEHGLSRLELSNIQKATVGGAHDCRCRRSLRPAEAVRDVGSLRLGGSDQLGTAAVAWSRRPKDGLADLEARAGAPAADDDAAEILAQDDGEGVGRNFGKVAAPLLAVAGFTDVATTRTRT